MSARRQPGKKFRIERFMVDAETIEVELRLTDSGRFYCEIDGAEHQAATMDEWREKVQRHLGNTRRLVWDPFIRVRYLRADSNSRWDNLRGESFREEIELAFSVVWISRDLVDGRKREAQGAVDPKTGKLLPLAESDRLRCGAVYAGDDDALPFTERRWQQLCAVAATICEGRKRLAEIVGDTSGASLDALPASHLLAPVEDNR